MKLWEAIGRTVYWAGWPVSYVYLRGSVRARVLVCAGDRVLLVKNWHGTGDWTLPGGGVERGEEAVRAATRELMEETGVALGIDQLTEITTTQVRQHGMTFQAVFFVATLQKTLPLRSKFPEIIDAQWIAKKDLHRYAVASEVHAALSEQAAVV